MVVIFYLGVAQLVARYLGVVEAAGSSPVTQTKKSLAILVVARLFYILNIPLMVFKTSF